MFLIIAVLYRCMAPTFQLQHRTSSALDLKRTMEVPNTSSIPFGKALWKGPISCGGTEAAPLDFWWIPHINKQITHTHTFQLKNLYFFDPYRYIIYIYKGHNSPPTPKKINNYMIQVTHPSPLAGAFNFRGFPGDGPPLSEPLGFWRFFFREQGKTVARNPPRIWFNSNVSCACLGKT